LGFTPATSSSATVIIRHLGVPQAQTNRIQRRVYLKKKQWFNALWLALRAKAESIKVKGCFVYLRFLQITGKNRRNSQLRRNSGFLRRGAGMLQTTD